MSIFSHWNPFSNIYIKNHPSPPGPLDSTGRPTITRCIKPTGRVVARHPLRAFDSLGHYRPWARGAAVTVNPYFCTKINFDTIFELSKTPQIQFWHSQTSPMPLRSENLLRITPIFIKICDFWPIFFIFLLKPPFFYAFSEDSVKVRPEFHAGLG